MSFDYPCAFMKCRSRVFYYVQELKNDLKGLFEIDLKIWGLEFAYSFVNLENSFASYL